MNKKQTTMLASTVMITVIGMMVLLSGVLNVHRADAETSRFSEGNAQGEGTKIHVEVNSPFGYERITSFKVFNTNNLMEKSGYHTLKLQGPVMSDKRTLLYWIAQDLGTLPNGLSAVMETHGGKEIKMTKPDEGFTIDKIPLSGTVTLSIFENSQDVWVTTPVRKVQFSGCHVAGYHLGSLHDNDRPYSLEVRYQHYEQVDFACSNIDELKGSAMNNRGVIVHRGIDNSLREIVNEKGELITQREYREPIVLQSYISYLNIDESNIEKQEIVTRTELDKTYYKVGDVAMFTVTFTDLEGNNIDPGTIKAVYDGKIVELAKQDTGIYTFTTPELIKKHHQLTVSAENDGFTPNTSYLSIPIHRIS